MKKVEFKVAVSGGIGVEMVTASGYDYKGFKIHWPVSFRNGAVVQQRSRYMGWFVTADCGYRVSPYQCNLSNIDKAKKFIDLLVEAGVKPDTTVETQHLFKDKYNDAVSKFLSLR